MPFSYDPKIVFCVGYMLVAKLAMLTPGIHGLKFDSSNSNVQEFQNECKFKATSAWVLSIK